MIYTIGKQYTAEEWKQGGGHWTNSKEIVNQKDFQSVFELLKVIRYQQKKYDKFKNFQKNKPLSFEQTPIITSLTSEINRKGISTILKHPHSIIDEVFSWEDSQLTREQIQKKGFMAEHISTPKMTGRSLQYSPVSFRKVNDSSFSPMTLSHAAVRNQNRAAGSSVIKLGQGIKFQ